MAMTNAELERELARLKAENDALKQATIRALSFRLNDKPTVKDGVESEAKYGISLLGLGQFPVTLYRGQWLRALDFLGTPNDHPVRAYFDSPAVLAADRIATARKAARKAS